MGITPRSGDDGSQNSAYHSYFPQRRFVHLIQNVYLFWNISVPNSKHVESNFHVRKNNWMQMSVLFIVDVNIVYYKFDLKKSDREGLLYYITNILFHQKLRRHIHSKANTEITKKYVTSTSILL